MDRSRARTIANIHGTPKDAGVELLVKVGAYDNGQVWMSTGQYHKDGVIRWGSPMPMMAADNPMGTAMELAGSMTQLASVLLEQHVKRLREATAD